MPGHRKPQQLAPPIADNDEGLQGIDLAGFKAGDRHVEPDFGEQDLQLLQFSCKRFTIPPGPFSQFVVGEAVGAQLSI